MIDKLYTIRVFNYAFEYKKESCELRAESRVYPKRYEFDETLCWNIY